MCRNASMKDDRRGVLLLEDVGFAWSRFGLAKLRTELHPLSVTAHFDRQLTPRLVGETNCGSRGHAQDARRHPLAFVTLLVGSHRATACDQSAERAELTQLENAQRELLIARDDDDGDDDDGDDDDGDD